MTPDENRRIRREEKRLKTEIKNLEAIPTIGASIVGGIIAVVAGILVPFTLAGFLLAFIISLASALVVMVALFFSVDGDLTRLKEERAALKRRRKGVNTSL